MPGRTKKPESNVRVAKPDLPPSWQAAIGDEFEKPYFKKLQEFLAAERAAHTVYPPVEDVYNAFKTTPLDKVKVLLLGQDPYHGPGQAHGLCFSVRPGVRRPPSLVNILKELHNDVGCPLPNHGCLQAWAERGVMLLNAVLTVRAGEANSHKDKGWEKLTDATIRALSDGAEPVVFLLWGSYAQKKEALIDTDRHVVLKAAHPSPLSYKKFLGSKPFSSANAALRKLGRGEIDWCLPDIEEA
jgi:uracil-DNA glycosylase